ncbi:MAG: hypothetical protein ABSG95_02655 [Solirubrobacteraceae bacterium]|jgi:hypothetical protein
MTEDSFDRLSRWAPERTAALRKLRELSHEVDTKLGDCLQSPILAYSVTAGWVTFVAPLWSRALLSAWPADLEVCRPDHRDGPYAGQIRLWK